MQVHWSCGPEVSVQDQWTPARPHRSPHPAVPYQELRAGARGDTSKKILKRVQQARAVQANRGFTNFQIPASKIRTFAALDSEHAVTRINYQDHGCELTPGLTELFVLESKLGRAKAVEYRQPLERLLDLASHVETLDGCGYAAPTVRA